MPAQLPLNQPGSRPPQMKIRQPIPGALRALHVLHRVAPTGLLALALAVSAPLPAFAAEPEQRLRELAELSERSNVKARAALLAEAGALHDAAPYAVRIQYLRLLRRVQNDAGKLREAYEVNERIMALAEAERDPVNIALASLVRINRQLDGNDPVAALALLETLDARYRNLGNQEFTYRRAIARRMSTSRGLHSSGLRWTSSRPRR